MQFAHSSPEHSASSSSMQGAYSQPMDYERPVRAARRARLLQLLDEYGGARSLMRLSGVTDTHLTACAKGRRDIGDEMASTLEAATGRPHGWMDSNASEFSAQEERLSLDQFLSQASSKMAPQIKWEAILSNASLPEEFIAIVPDDAMQDHVKRGTRCIFRSASVSTPGQGILVKDKYDQLHLRMHQQGTSTKHWLAVADNPAYRTLDSVADELVVLATVSYALKGWDE